MAPFAGVVVSGDLGQAIGGPVELGEVLFEVAALDDHRIVLAVDERDIARIEPGQHAELRLAASPGRALALTVERVVPLAESAEGRNRFRVEARFGEAPAGLRPGMAGVARLNAGRESLWWILTHELRERLALWAWSNGLW